MSSDLAGGISLIVGLGNPTARYEKTRHNAGFWFVDAVARELGVAVRQESSFMGAVGSYDEAGGRVYLLKPSTYMNRSGDSVAAFAAYFKIPPQAMLIVHDELDLPPGTVRLKRGGGHGGHNGLRDIIAKIGSPDFYRLRLGIGHPGDRDKVADYVLDGPGVQEASVIERAIMTGVGELGPILRAEMPAVMGRINSSSIRAKNKNS